jgi:GTP pyrophosphokinase
MRGVAPQAEVQEAALESVVKANSSRYEKHSKSNAESVIVDSVDGCTVKFAKCCNPLPGDNIIGYITRGYGVSIHKYDCPNVTSIIDHSEYADRWVKAEWEHGHNEGSNAGVYEAFIQLHTEDRIGMLADIATALADMRVAILSVNSQKRSNGMGIINLKVSCKNTDHYQSIMSRLKSLAGVVDVVRGYSS